MSDAAMNAAIPPPLFERLGGRTRLALFLRHFYADVRQHREIGPIFTAAITDWPSHLGKIADFWSGATGGPVLHSGPMPYKHLRLGLEEKHFEAWLELWRRNCRVHLPTGAAEEMITAAERIGGRLRQIVGVK